MNAHNNYVFLFRGRSGILTPGAPSPGSAPGGDQLSAGPSRRQSIDGQRCENRGTSHAWATAHQKDNIRASHVPVYRYSLVYVVVVNSYKDTTREYGGHTSIYQDTYLGNIFDGYYRPITGWI